jgi:hypothetical protein
MNDFLTLAYLDFHQLLHRVQTIFRQPGRALVYVLVIGYFVFVSVARSHTRMSMFSVVVPEPFASAIMAAFIALLGIIMYGAASGFVGVFSSAADARFLCGSQLSEAAVVTWLQLRRCASVVLRTAFAVIFYAFFLPRGAAFGVTGLIGLAVIAGTLFTSATAVPMLKLRATVGSRFARTFAAAIVAAGLLPLAILLGSLLNSGLAPWAHAIQSIGAGYAVNALFHGNAAGLTSFYAAAGAMLCLSFVTGRDLYPELYASSLRVQAFRQRRRRVPGFIATERAYRSSGPLAPSRIFEGARGAWTIAWKEWIAFMRAPGARRMFWVGLAGCAIAGAIFGNIAIRSRNPLETALLLGSSVANMVIIFITIASSFGLAEDLRKPLWWMGPDPIWLRLLAWVLATSWRLAICIAIGTVVFAAILGLNVVAVTGIPIAITIAVYLRSIGLALYALLPSGLDQRGPLAMLRALLTYLFTLPGIAASVLAAIVTHSLAAAVAAGILVSLAEALGLIAFAAARIQGRGATFAQAEAA